MKITAIADMHSRYKASMTNLPPADVLVIAGDITKRGKLGDLEGFCVWLNRCKKRFKKVLTVSGNHDWCFMREHEKEIAIKMVEDAGAIHLQDTEIVIDGVKFYGSPWQPKFGSWAFNLMRMSSELKEVWGLIPENTDVLITHTPPYQMLDLTYNNEHVGCESLATRINYELQNLKAHIFGHVHEAYGSNGIFHNASICNKAYEAVNAPIVIEIE